MIRKLLIANRGEIAVRIARTARELGIGTVSVFSEEDEASAHIRAAHEAHRLDGRGPAAYLDSAQIVAAAREHGCDAVHPGYGFLSENAAFAHSCADAGITFVGPSPELIELYGDKLQARALAQGCCVPVPEGTKGPATAEEIAAFLQSLGPGSAAMIKAVAGGGGRGMRLVESAGEVEEAYARCRSEAERAFGDGALYAERLIRSARHIEVQIAGDGGEVSHLWERDCTLQRRNQKLVELAPAPGLAEALREQLLDAACRMAAQSGFDNIGTFEFLIDLDEPGAFAFIEANPRLQVEHTVTEEVLGLDLVRIQLELASGRKLAELGLGQQDIARPRGFAMQLRINMESMDESGQPRPGSGTIGEFILPGGPGVRVDTFGHAGYRTVATFDSLLAKLIVSCTEDSLATLLARARRALAEFSLSGVPTNLPFLKALLDHPGIAANEMTTGFIADHIAELMAAMPREDVASDKVVNDVNADGWTAVPAPMTGIVASLSAEIGDPVAQGAAIAIIEAMKMEHVVRSPCSGIVRAVASFPGSQVEEGSAILLIEERDVGEVAAAEEDAPAPDHIRSDLAELHERIAETLDENRPTAVEKRRGRGQRTARENVADLCDEGSFIEFGQLAVAYLHSRRSMDDLRAATPADGFVAGLATVNAETFGAETAAVAVGSYDATVMAGTLGHMNHKKADRLFALAGERGIPLVLFAEGGGGRPREDPVTIAGLHSHTFLELAKLSGKVPVVGIVSGRCFAGNAALLGLVDTIIATEDSTIGMAGPALIEAAGLGSCTPEEVGPIDLQCRSGVVDIRVADEAEAVAVTKRYLSYFQGRLPEWEAGDERLLRHAVPENRLRAYDVRDVGRLIADSGSWLELRPDFGQSYVTALIRVDGRPLGVIANNPMFNAGAIDSDGSDKAARFMRLCDAHGLPLLSLIDTPGIMVGTEAEATGLVRHSARMFATAASLTVPIFAVVLRKAYGLGGAAAAGGHFHAPFFTVAWPTGELGGMGLEGGVRLAYKRELEAIEDPAERQAFFEERVAARYAKGKATYAATYFELDAVIDPADTRRWITQGMEATGKAGKPGSGRFIDTW